MKYRDKDGILHDNVIIKGESAFESAQIGGYSKTEEEFYKDLSDLETKTSVDEKLDAVKSEFDEVIEDVKDVTNDVFEFEESMIPTSLVFGVTEYGTINADGSFGTQSYVYRKRVDGINENDKIVFSNPQARVSDTEYTIAFYNSSNKFISGVHATGSTSDTIYATAPKGIAYTYVTSYQEVKLSSGFFASYKVNKIFNEMFFKNNLALNMFENYSKKILGAFQTIGVIGDSLASGECVSNEGGLNHYNDLYEYSWIQFIARELGIKAFNFSKGGLHTRDWLTDSVGLSKLQNADNKCNAYFIGLGTNDAERLGISYLGGIDDIKDDFTQNADTFYGNYGKIISNIKLVQPKSKIFIFTMPSKLSIHSQFNVAIREIANKFDNVYLLDLEYDNDFYRNPIINACNRAGHYNAIGYEIMGQYICEKVGKLIINNIDEFKQIEFIGTDKEWND